MSQEPDIEYVILLEPVTVTCIVPDVLPTLLDTGDTDIAPAA